MCAFVIGYVWQNIEVMRIKMGYKRLQAEERALLHKNDRLLYEIEKLKKTAVISNIAETRGYKHIEPSDFDVIAVKE